MSNPVLICMHEEKILNFINILEKSWNENENNDIDVFSNCFVDAIKEVETNQSVFSNPHRLQECINIYVSWIQSYLDKDYIPEFVSQFIER